MNAEGLQVIEIQGTFDDNDWRIDNQPCFWTVFKQTNKQTVHLKKNSTTKIDFSHLNIDSQAH